MVSFCLLLLEQPACDWFMLGEESPPDTNEPFRCEQRADGVLMSSRVGQQLWVDEQQQQQENTGSFQAPVSLREFWFRLWSPTEAIQQLRN